ncbi:MAG: hypothetical protein ACHQYP_07660 [Nitrospiria bacterium]
MGMIRSSGGELKKNAAQMVRRREDRFEKLPGKLIFILTCFTSGSGLFRKGG